MMQLSKTDMCDRVYPHDDSRAVEAVYNPEFLRNARRKQKEQKRKLEAEALQNKFGKSAPKPVPRSVLKRTFMFYQQHDQHVIAYRNNRMTFERIKHDAIALLPDDIGWHQITGQKRTFEIVAWRQAVMHAAYNYLGLSTTQVGRLMGGKDHSTVIHGTQKVNSEIKAGRTIKVVGPTGIEFHLRQKTAVEVDTLND